MTRFFSAAIAAVVILVLAGAAPGQDAKDPAAVIDKAIKALGGEEKLSKAKGIQFKASAKFRFGDNESEGTIEGTSQGLDHVRRVFEGEFGGNKVRGVTVVAGDKGWRKFGDNAMELDSDGLANEKRRIYLSQIPMTIVPVKSKGFKIAAAGEEQVNGKPASGMKVTAPDGKDFTLYFDKETGLPVKLVADVVGFGGDEFTQEMSFSDYKELDGIKVATKLEAKRDGTTFQEMKITEFKVLDKVDPKTFAEPE
ncbi:MAG: hypothetical protein WD894_00865 [Pirellulales bacterium]